MQHNFKRQTTILTEAVVSDNLRKSMMEKTSSAKKAKEDEGKYK